MELTMRIATKLRTYITAIHAALFSILLAVSPAIVALCLIATGASSGWQSRDSNYNVSVSAGGTYTGPGDVVGNWNAWWGLRAFNGAYAASLGNIADIVDTATGAASCTIKSNSSGNADLTSLSCVGGTVSVTTFCTVTHAAGCSVKKLYDQSGASACSGACDVSQATLANMPLLLLGSVTGLTSSRPAMSFNGSSQSLRNLSGPTNAQPISFLATMYATSASASIGMIAGGGTAELIGNNGIGNDTIGVYSGGAVVGQAATHNNWFNAMGVCAGASSHTTKNGTAGSTSNAGTAGIAGAFLFGVSNFSEYMVGNMTEGGSYTNGPND
jgi:hypothetical protein